MLSNSMGTLRICQSVLVALVCANISSAAAEVTMQVQRLAGNPIITPASSDSIGTNINGPSVIRVPDWVEHRLGRYYLYFAHHKGKHIRLAFADEIGGPWNVYEPGALRLEDSQFPTAIDEASLADRLRERLASTGRPARDFIYAHIASPEVVVVPETKHIRLYYHGMLENGAQATRVAVSGDGIDFKALPGVITRPYLRVFRRQGWYYGMAMPGVVYRSRDGLTDFEEGPTLFNGNMRHAALWPRGSTLNVFWTQVGDQPERILLSSIDMGGDWQTWHDSAAVDVLGPEMPWEGTDLPLHASVRGAIEEPANQLRDPAIFEDDGKVWLFYSIAGESGIAVAQITLQE